MKDAMQTGRLPNCAKHHMSPRPSASIIESSPGFSASRPERRLERATREDHAVFGAVDQFDALRRARKDHAVLADHAAAAQRREADAADGSRTGLAVAAAVRALREIDAAAFCGRERPSSSAVPDGASIFLL